MLTKPQQAVYRPLVDRAWLEHCRMGRISPNNRPAKDAWYRNQVHSTTGHWSTKECNPSDDFRRLIDRFMLLAGEPQLIMIQPWSDSQNEWFNKEAQKAWEAERVRGSIEDGITYESWLAVLMLSHEIDVTHHIAPDRTRSFDAVMAELGTITGDERVISHFSEATEIRARFQIQRYMSDLTWLEGSMVTWEYVRAIWKQAALLPDLDEAPAATLIQVLQMLDTHIRRRCKECEIRPKCLPSRCIPETCKGDCRCPSGRPSSRKDQQVGGTDTVPF